MKPLVKIRPITLKDLDALLYLTQNIGYGVTHLPPENDLLSEKIRHSTQSFSKNIEAIQDELYFFVMEELATAQVIGCCGIISQASLAHPFYNFKITQQVHSSESLHIVHQNNYLQLNSDYQGLSEVGMLALLPEHQHHHIGRFLSRSRFLFLADNLNRVTDKIITQIRGVVDKSGHSIFWRALGKKFIELPFLEIDHLIAKGCERFVAELLPDTPIPLELLPEDVRILIGETHPDSAPALALLKNEGFTFENYINIFEGGPCLELYLKHNPTILNSKLVQIQGIKKHIDSDIYMMATVDQEFCACQGPLLLHEHDTVMITEQTAEILNLQIGDRIRISL